jgi:AcrR family transcriptional regulator
VSEKPLPPDARAAHRRPRGRPPKIDPQHILKVAREVFIAQGLRATTAEVAEKAGISEGSVFKLFGSKVQLFRDAMQLSIDDLPGRLLGAVQGMESEDMEAGLNHLADSLLEVARVALPLMMMSWSNPGECGAGLRENADKFHIFIKTLASYFETHMLAGRLRRVDSEVLARVFLGAMHHYCLSRICVDEFGVEAVPEDMFKRGLIDLVLNGARPRAELRSSPYSRRQE